MLKGQVNILSDFVLYKLVDDIHDSADYFIGILELEKNGENRQKNQLFLYQEVWYNKAIIVGLNME